MASTPPLRHILITGASSGIGAALARAYAAPGVVLGLTGRNGKRLRQVARDCEGQGARVLADVVDVTDRAAMADLLVRLDSEAPLDLVIANAGISAGMLADADGNKTGGETEEQARDIFSVNLAGVLNTIWPAIHLMRARGVGQIAIISSLSAYRGMPGAPAYSASKAAVKAYGEALRPRLADDGIRLSVVCPGFVESRITAQNTFPMPFFMGADTAARRIRQGLLRNSGLIAFPWPMRLISWIFGALPAPLADRLGTRLPRKN